MTPKRKAQLDAAVDKIISDYGEVLIKLSKT